MALLNTDNLLVGRDGTSYRYSIEKFQDSFKGQFVPIDGTIDGAPVIGDVEFQNGKKILFGSNGNGLTIKQNYWGGLYYVDQLQFEFGKAGLKAGVDLQMKIGNSGDTNPRNRITLLADPQDMYDAVTKKYVDDKYDELDLDNLQLDGYLPLTGGVMTGLLVNDEISVGPYPSPKLGVEPLSFDEVTPTLYVNTGTLTADADGLGSDLTDLIGWYQESVEKPNDAETQSITQVEFDGEESETGYAYIYTHKYDSPDYYYSFSLEKDVREWTKVVGTDIRGMGSRLYGIISTRLDDGTVRYIGLGHKGITWKDNDFRGDGWQLSTGYPSDYTYIAAGAVANGSFVYAGSNSDRCYFSTDAGVSVTPTILDNTEKFNLPVALGSGFLFSETGLSGGSKDKLSYTENGVNWTYVKFNDIVSASDLGGTTIGGTDVSPTKIGEWYYIAASNKIIIRSKTPLDISSYEKLPEVPYRLRGIHGISENFIVLLMNQRNYHPYAVVNGDWDNLQRFDFQSTESPRGGIWNHFVSDDSEFMYLNDKYSIVKVENDNFSFSGTGEQHIYWNNEQLATVADLRSVLHYAKEEFNKDESVLAQKLEDAPSDGETYVRKDGEWVQEEPFDDSHLLPLAGGNVTGEVVFNTGGSLNGVNGGNGLTIEAGKITTKSNVDFSATRGNFNFRGGASGAESYINVYVGTGSKLFEVKRGYNFAGSNIQYFGNMSTGNSIVTKSYVDNKISNLGDILTFKGALDLVNIAAPASPSVGDVYASNVSGTPDASWGLDSDVVAGELYGRGETEWALIGGASIDLTGYATETYVDVQTALRTPLNLGSLPELPTV